MPQILVVEGLTDATFFQELLSRLYLNQPTVKFGEQLGRRNIPVSVSGAGQGGTSVEVEFRNQEGKAAIPDVIRGLIEEHVALFAVAQDIDFGSPKDLVESILRVEDSYIASQVLEQLSGDRTVTIQDSTIHVIPMGLNEDLKLANLGIVKHEMEDYLIKLMFEDPKLRTNAPELESLLAKLLPIVREHEGPFNSGKEVFQLTKPIVQHGFSDTGVVSTLVRTADEGILRRVVAPLLPVLEQALSL